MYKMGKGLSSGAVYVQKRYVRSSMYKEAWRKKFYVQRTAVGEIICTTVHSAMIVKSEHFPGCSEADSINTLAPGDLFSIETPAASVL